MTGDRAGGERAARRAARLPRWLPLVLATALLAGCTGDGPEGGDGDDGGSVALEVRVVSCAGRLGEDARAEIESGIGDTLSAYVVRAFLGDYPRDDFVRSFDAFTSGAAASAAEDIDLLTGSRFKDAEGVVATRLSARISCLVERGDVVGATAKVAFDFEAQQPDAEQPQPFSLRGRILMTPGPDAWSVFGYDVARDDVPAAEARS
ncbi:MAG: hypothetical protein ABWX84_04950 [Nocardioides sp.]